VSEKTEITAKLNLPLRTHENRRDRMPARVKTRVIRTDKTQLGRLYLVLVWVRVAAMRGELSTREGGWVWLGDLPEFIDRVRVGDRYSIVKNVYDLRKMGFVIEERTKEGHGVAEYRMDRAQAWAEWVTWVRDLVAQEGRRVRPLRSDTGEGTTLWL